MCSRMRKTMMMVLPLNSDSEDDANGVDNAEVNQEGHEASIFTIAFSPNGKLLVTGGQDGFCRSVTHLIECSAKPKYCSLVIAGSGVKSKYCNCRLWQADDGWRCSQKWEHARCWKLFSGRQPPLRLPLMPKILITSTAIHFLKANDTHYSQTPCDDNDNDKYIHKDK